MIEFCKVEQLDSSPSPENTTTEAAVVAIPAASLATTPSKQRSKKPRKGARDSQSPPAAQRTKSPVSRSPTISSDVEIEPTADFVGSVEPTQRIENNKK